MYEPLKITDLLYTFTTFSSIRHIRRMLNKMGLYRSKQKSSVRDIVSAVLVSHPVLRRDL